VRWSCGAASPPSQVESRQVSLSIIQPGDTILHFIDIVKKRINGPRKRSGRDQRRNKKNDDPPNPPLTLLPPLPAHSEIGCFGVVFGGCGCARW
jgi:hypothetical protein